ncbi:MAG: primosomal protein N' [Puniceicoccales bacterium]|jgi:primosomal protein N' (replication factor Y)|nr:primosomal protein N' [Puniceicoccales bacterium]
MAVVFVAEVLVFAPIDRPLKYTIPEALCSAILPGSLVHITVGKVKKMGLVCRIHHIDPQSLTYTLKSIISMIYDIPITHEILIQFYFWIAKYYVCDLFSVIDTAIPNVIRKNIPLKLIPYLQLSTPVCTSIDPKKCPKQYEALEFLKQNPYLLKNKFLERFSRNILDTLLQRNAVYETFQREERIAYTRSDLIHPQHHPIQLTAEQWQVVHSVNESLDQRTFNVHLLHGVTGSGKTEVYIKLIERVIREGGSVLYLLPELALTAQIVEKIRSRLEGLTVWVWHSSLSDGERRDTWFGALNHTATVIVGARSALFLPLNHLRLIIVDEEHEFAYKQNETPRYHGRDAAIYRAKLHGATCLLGSATPSVESIFNTRFKNYKLETLPHRIDHRPLPLVHIVDMRYEPQGHYGVLSRLLVEKMKTCLEKKEQIILFLNRRGYATTILCKSCDFIASCPHCSVPLTFHKTIRQFLCHFCSYQEQPHTQCPQCGSPEIFYRGIGTQKIEQITQNLFLNACVARIDSDVMGKKHKFIHILNDFRSGKIDILVGTQMIAKGLDFPNVTLVGLINADGALNQQDFRANEKTFQLLVQVAGRSGRGDHGGEVVLQTHIPNNETIFLAKNADFNAFIDRELSLRQHFAYPPYRHIIHCNISGTHLEATEVFAKESFIKQLREVFAEDTLHTEIRGPMTSPIEKIQDRYRYFVLIFTRNISKTCKKIYDFSHQIHIPQGIFLSIDVDALDFV